jgi:hypothetical protein
MAVSCHLKLYTVHPLPPADMSFDEALECLKRGEKVIMNNDGQFIFILPSLKGELLSSGLSTYQSLSYMKGMRFRKA